MEQISSENKNDNASCVWMHQQVNWHKQEMQVSQKVKKRKKNTRRGLIKWGYNIGLKIQTQAVSQSGGSDPKTNVWKRNRKQVPSTENPEKSL